MLASRFPSDPSAQWAFLNGLGARLGRAVSSIGNSSSRPDTTPPLAPADIDLVLASIRSLRQRRPDWVQGSILSNTLTELKRAQRLDEETRIYREVAESAGDSSSLLSLMQVAGDRGDVETLLKLIEKYDRLAGSRSSSFVSSFNGPAYALMRAANHLANAKSHRDIPKLLDHYLLSQRRQRLSGKPTRSSTASATLNRSRYIIYNASGTLREHRHRFSDSQHVPQSRLSQSPACGLRALQARRSRQRPCDGVPGSKRKGRLGGRTHRSPTHSFRIELVGGGEGTFGRGADTCLGTRQGDAELRFPARRPSGNGSATGTKPWRSSRGSRRRGQQCPPAPGDDGTPTRSGPGKHRPEARVACDRLFRNPARSVDVSGRASRSRCISSECTSRPRRCSPGPAAARTTAAHHCSR